MDARRWDRLSLGVTNGLKAWLWYGVAEYLLHSAGPLLFQEYSVVMAAQWRGTVLLLACYAIAGAVLGLGSALLAGRQGHLTPSEFARRNQAVLALTVIGAFSFFKLGVDRFPKIDFPVVSVITANPGASPQEIDEDEPHAAVLIRQRPA